MTRSLSAGMIAHLAGSAHTRAVCLRLDLADGSVLAVTDHDRALSIDLGDGAVSYSPATGILPSDLATACGFSASDVEVRGPVTETGLTTLAALLGGRFDDATARLFEVNWADLSHGVLRLLNGYVALVTVEGSQFRLTIHSEVSRFTQTIGRVISAYCDADFMDARCGYSEAALTATVSAVTDEREFSVTYSGTFINDYFNRGTVTFTGGALAGTRRVEIFDFASGGAGAGALALYAPLAQAPLVGDTLTIKRGCGKTRAACLAYGNVINFRGCPDVPGTDQVLKYPNGGQA